HFALAARTEHRFEVVAWGHAGRFDQCERHARCREPVGAGTGSRFQREARGPTQQGRVGGVRQPAHLRRRRLPAIRRVAWRLWRWTMSWRPGPFVRLITVLALFVIVAVAISTVVVCSGLNLQTRSAGTYHAVLNEASGLREGDNVKIAGLTVGRVQEVELRDDTVLLTFTVADERTVYTDTHAQVKFANLIGNRYLALSLRTGTGSPAGTGGGAAADAEGEPLDEGGTIPLSQTEPAIDLTAVFNGFQPLFDALTPDEINELSMSIIEVLQGQSGDVSHLVEQIATITQNLAVRKGLIGSVI